MRFMARHRQAVKIAGLTVVLVTVFCGGLLLAPRHAELAETNFQANLIRLQTFMFDAPPRTVLVGSSLTGRLLPSYFRGTDLAPAANLGLDGSGPVFGLELALQRPAQTVIIEVNTLLKPRDKNDQLIEDTLHGLNFQLARHLPFLRADARPSSMLYSFLKTRRKHSFTDTPINPTPLAQATAPTQPAPSDDPATRAAKEKLQADVKALLERGSRVALVRLPMRGRSSSQNNPSYAWGDELAREFRLPLIDIEAECLKRGRVISYTDGLHLTPTSARETSVMVSELLAARQHTASLSAQTVSR